MEFHGGPAAPDATGTGTVNTEVGPNLGEWFQRGLTSVTNIGEKGADLVGGILDRFREADALAYDNDGDQTDN